MKISSLAEDIVTVPFEHNGEVVNLQVNRNIVTPAYLREIGEQYQAIEAAQTAAKSQKPGKSKKSKKSEDTNDFAETARQIEQQIKVYVPLLTGGLLKGWDLTDDDGVTPISVEDGLNRLAAEAPLLVVDLWSAAMEAAQAEKKIPTTLPATDSGLLETPEAKSTDALSM